MALLVKKFGGTSVGDIKKIKNIASSICQSKEAGNEIVVVLSAISSDSNSQLFLKSIDVKKYLVIINPIFSKSLIFSYKKILMKA